MNTLNRHRNRWTVNEVLELQREYELLNWTIDDIATKHQRTPNAIMHKLNQEGIADYNVLYSNYENLNVTMNTKKNNDLEFEVNDYDEDEDEDEDYEFNGDEEDNCDEDEDEEEDEITQLAERVDSLESSIDEIKNMVKQLINNSSTKSSLSKW
jgi:TATA-binding protein-associated factor Taf7